MRWLAVVSCALALWIVATTLRGVLEHYHPMPWEDDWASVADARAWHEGQMSLARLFDQHNEHRIPFARLVFLADHLWLGGRGILAITCIALIQVLHAGALLALLARCRPPLPRSQLAIGAATLGACMLSSAQMANLIWSIQLSVVLVYFAVTLAFLSMVGVARASSDRRRRLWLLAALAAAVVATFSRANGILVWPLLLGFGWLARVSGRWLVLLGLAAALIAGLHFASYVTPENADPRAALDHLPRAFVNAIAWFGIPAQGFGRGAALAMGGLGLVLALGAFWRLARGWRVQTATESALAAMLLFPFVSAFATSFARIEFGLPPLPSRYATDALYFWALLVALALGRGRRLAIAWLLPLLVVLLVQQRAGIRRLDERTETRELAALSLITNVWDESVMRTLTLGREHETYREIRLLRDERLSVFASSLPGLIGSRIDQRFRVAPPADDAGRFEGWAPVAGVSGGVSVFGRLGAAARHDLVAITDREQRIVGLASARWSDRWRGYARIAGMDAPELTAWAVRADGSAVALAGAQTPALEVDPTRDSLGAQLDLMRCEGPIDVARAVASQAGSLRPLLGLAVVRALPIEPVAGGAGSVDRVEPLVADLPAVCVFGRVRDADTVLITDQHLRVLGVGRALDVQNDSEGTRWVGYAVPPVGVDCPFQAFALARSGRALHRLEDLAAAFGDVDVAGFDDLGPTLTDSASGGGWVENGELARYLAPPIDGPVFDSWSGSDGSAGELRFAPFAQDDVAALGLPILVGGRAEGMSVRVVDHDSGATVAQLSDLAPFCGRWRVWRVPLPAGQRRLAIVAEDRGSGRGAWLALCAPRRLSR
jgi:hypothetical protein